MFVYFPIELFLSLGQGVLLCQRPMHSNKILYFAFEIGFWICPMTSRQTTEWERPAREHKLITAQKLSVTCYRITWMGHHPLAACHTHTLDSHLCLECLVHLGIPFTKFTDFITFLAWLDRVSMQFFLLSLIIRFILIWQSLLAVYHLILYSII